MNLKESEPSQCSAGSFDDPIKAHRAVADLSTFGVTALRSDLTAQRRLKTSIQSSPRVLAQQQEFQHLSEQATPIQKVSTPNKTGMPDSLKSGIERLSGMDMSDTRVHYNSSRPAQLNAHAFAQGQDIHLGHGQEKHLPHEAWHVVQQKQGRVHPTTQTKGVNINDSASLEKEADVMGAKAVSL